MASSHLASLILLTFLLLACIEASCPPSPTPIKPTPPSPPKPKPKPTPPTPSPSPPKPKPKPSSPPKPACPPPPTPSTPAKCPINALKLGVCADVLGGLVHIVIGEPPSGSKKCCTLLKGLADVEAAACLCTAIKGKILGAVLDIPLAIQVLLSSCQKTLPPAFTCPH